MNKLRAFSGTARGAPSASMTFAAAEFSPARARTRMSVSFARNTSAAPFRALHSAASAAIVVG
jgi:hypothetical protein